MAKKGMSNYRKSGASKSAGSYPKAPKKPKASKAGSTKMRYGK